MTEIHKLKRKRPESDVGDPNDFDSEPECDEDEEFSCADVFDSSSEKQPTTVPVLAGDEAVAAASNTATVIDMTNIVSIIKAKTGADVTKTVTKPGKYNSETIVCNTNDKRCRISKVEHAHNHVYFQLDVNTQKLTQRCNNTECKKGEHVIVESPSKPLVDNLVKLAARDLDNLKVSSFVKCGEKFNVFMQVPWISTACNHRTWLSVDIKAKTVHIKCKNQCGNVQLYPKLAEGAVEELTDIQKLILTRGDKGRGQAIVKLFKGTIICIDVKSKMCFVFNEDTALFEECSMDSTCVVVMTKLYELCEGVEGKLRVKHDKEIQNLNMLNAMLPCVRCALKELKDPLLLSKLDRIPHLLPTPNKTVVNLKTGEVLPRTREHLFTIECPYSYDKDADTSEIRKYFESIMGCEEMADYLSIQMGYAITGETSERTVKMHNSQGRNGKSTFFEKFMGPILGGFYAVLPKGCIIDSGGKDSSGAASPELFCLTRVRLAIFDEICENEQVNARNLKKIADGGDLKARTLYSAEYTVIKVLAKMHILTNKPLVYDTQDTAMNDRFECNPWPTRYVKINEAPAGANPGDDLGGGRFVENREWLTALETEHMGNFFSYLVNYAMRFYAQGKTIRIPKAAADETQRNVDLLDSVGAFVREACVLSTNDRTPAIHMYKQYSTYCSTVGIVERRVNNKDFAKMLLLKHGVEKVKNSTIYFNGIRCTM